MAAQGADRGNNPDLNRAFEDYRAGPENKEQAQIEKAIRQSIQQLIDEIAKDESSKGKLKSLLDKESTEPTSKEMPLLSEQKGVVNGERGLGIEITAPAIKEAFIGPNGRSLAEDMFRVLAGKEKSTSTPGQPGDLMSELNSIKSVTLGGHTARTGFSQVELIKEGDKDSETGIETLRFVKANDNDPHSNTIAIRIVRSQDKVSGLPDAKVYLDLGIKDDKPSLTDNIANIPERLDQIQFILDYKPGLSDKERDSLSAEAATLRADTVKGLNKESQQANQAALMKDLAALMAIARERGHTVMAQSSAGAPVDSPESRQLRALEVFSRIIETPGSLINRTKKVEKSEAKSGKQEQTSKTGEFPADVQELINKLTSKGQDEGKTPPVRKLDNNGLPLPTTSQETGVKVQNTERLKTPKVEAPKAPEELKTQFEAELTAIKDLRKKKEDIEAQIKALGTAEVGTLSDADKKKLDALNKELAEAKQGLEILQAIGDLQLHDRKKGAVEKAKTALKKGKFTNEIDPDAIMTVEQLSRLSVSDLLAILKLNAEYTKDMSSKSGDVVKSKEQFDKINVLVVLLTQFSTENDQAARDSSGKDKPKGIHLLTVWLTDRDATLTADIAKLNATGKSAESTNKERDEKLALLKKELAQVENDLGAANLRAANILRGMGDQVPMDEWMKMSSALHEASFGDLPEVPNPAEAAAKTEAAANASIAANCLRHIDLELEQRLEPETSKVKKFFKRAAEVLTSVFGGIAARTAVKAVVTGALGLALGGPAGLLVGGLAGALAGGASSAIFSTYMHYKVFNNDKMHALYAENANPGKYDFFKGKIFEKANETYGVKARVQNIASVYNAMATGQLQPGQITPEQAQTLLAVVKDSKVLKNTTNFIGVNNLGLDAALFKNAAGETVLPEDALRDFALKFDNFVNASINAGKLSTVDVAASLKKADEESKVMVDAMIASASWTKFFKGALIGGASGLISQGISNALEGHGFFGTASSGTTGSNAEGIVATQPNMSEEQVLKLNEEALKHVAPYGQQQYDYLHQTYSNIPESDLQGMFKSFDANGNGLIDGPEMKIFVESLHNTSTGGVGGGLVGNWEAPVDGNISKALPEEWVDTWTKGIYGVGRGHDFHGAQFSMQGTPGGHQYALARALDYMSKNVPAENMNTPEAGISVSHLYGHLLLGGKPTDADLAEYLTRIDAKYDGAGYDVSSIFSGSVGTATASSVDSATVIAGLDQINGAAYNELSGLWETVANSADAGSVTQTVAGSVGNFIVDSTRQITELGTTGALAGMGVSMWLANMYTPENREYAKPKAAEATAQQNQGNGGTTPTPGVGNGTGTGTATPTNTPPQNSNTPLAQPVAAYNSNTNPVINNQNPVPGGDQANGPENSAQANTNQANANVSLNNLGFRPITSPGTELSTDTQTGRLIAPAITWRDQSGELSQFALQHEKLNALRLFGSKLGNGIWQTATAAFRGGNPFSGQFYNEVVNNVKVNNSFVVLDTQRNIVKEEAFNTTGLRQQEMEYQVGKQVNEMREGIRGHLKNFIRQALEIEFGNSPTALTAAEGRDQLNRLDKEAVDLFMKKDAEAQINDEMLDSFLNLMVILNDPKNLDATQQKLNQQGQGEYSAIVKMMLQREDQWQALLPGKASAQLSTKYRGMPLSVSDAIVRASLELSGFSVTDQMRRSAQYFTNIDQMTRSAGQLNAKGGLYNALQAIRASVQDRGGRLGVQRQQVQVNNQGANVNNPVQNIVWNPSTPEAITRPTGARSVTNPTGANVNFNWDQNDLSNNNSPAVV